MYKFFKDKHGNTVLWQFPNIPLWAWIIFTLLSMILSHGKAHSGLHLLAESSLFTWAYLEVRHGESMFRQFLGGIVLIAIIVSYFR